VIEIAAVNVVETFDFLYEPADIVLKATLFRRETGRGKSGRRLEDPMFYRQAKRQGRLEDFMSAEFYVKMSGVTHALPGKPTPDLIRICAAQALAAKTRIYGRKLYGLPYGEEDEDEYRAGAQWIHRYMTSKFIGVIKEAEWRGRLPFQIRIDSLHGEMHSSAAMLDEIGVLKIYRMLIPALMDSQTTIDSFTEERKAGEKRIEVYLFIANKRFLLLRFRNWANPVSPSIIMREAEALQRIWRFLQNCGFSGITVYVCPSVEGGEEAERKLRRHGMYVLKIPQIQPEELARQVEEWTGIDQRRLYPSPSEWPLRVREMILAFISKYLKIQLLKKRKEQFRVVNSPPSKITPLYEKTECEAVEIERMNWLFHENFESEVEKIWSESEKDVKNNLSKRNVFSPSFLKTKYEDEDRGISGEKNGFPLFRRGEIDTYLPIFSVDYDPERFTMRGLGPPRNVDPRLAA